MARYTSYNQFRTLDLSKYLKQQSELLKDTTQRGHFAHVNSYFNLTIIRIILYFTKRSHLYKLSFPYHDPWSQNCRSEIDFIHCFVTSKSHFTTQESIMLLNEDILQYALFYFFSQFKLRSLLLKRQIHMFCMCQIIYFFNWSTDLKSEPIPQSILIRHRSSIYTTQEQTLKFSLCEF